MNYKGLRNKYLSKNLKLIFILESPPSGLSYFYNDQGRVGELLFRSMIKCLFPDFTPQTKKEGLEKFSQAGYLIVDPIYKPVNKLPDKIADELILKNYNNFKKDLKSLMGKKNIPLILVKANVCRLLESRLLADGFKVLNNGVSIPFPMHYHYRKFEEKISKIIKDF